MLSEKDKALFEFFATAETINICASIITNIILIYLILYRSSQEIGSYRYLLLAFAINDINYPVVHYFTLPVICSYNDALIMFSRGILTSRVSICLYACTFSQTMPLLAHLFIYRLLATKWPYLIKFYTAKSCFFLTVITIAIESSLWFLNCYYNYAPDQETIAYVRPFIDEYFEGEGEGFIGALYYARNISIDGKFRMRAFLATMGFNSIMCFCMAVIGFCAVNIVLCFRAELGSSEVSINTRKLQIQLFKTLVYQGLMIIPIVFVYLPCVINFNLCLPCGIINLPMLGYRVNLFPNLVSASTTLFPLIDVFVIILGVRSYRRSILFFLKGKPQSNIHHLSTVAPSSTTGALFQGELHSVVPPGINLSRTDAI